MALPLKRFVGTKVLLAAVKYIANKILRWKCYSYYLLALALRLTLIILFGNLPFMDIMRRSMSLFVRPGIMTCPVNSSYNDTQTDQISMAKSSIKAN